MSRTSPAERYGVSASELNRLRAEMIDLHGPELWCWRCGVLITGTVHAGHVVDRAMGGETVIENLRPECPRCNLSAGGRLSGQMRRARNFSPRVVVAERGTLFGPSITTGEAR